MSSACVHPQMSQYADVLREKNLFINNFPFVEKKVSSKKVTFFPHANVVLIPTVEEYYEAGLAHRLWWNDSDFRSFKSSTAKEVQLFIKDKPSVSNKEALKLYCENLGEEILTVEAVPEAVVVAPVVSVPEVADEIPSVPELSLSESVNEVENKDSNDNNSDNNEGNNSTDQNSGNSDVENIPPVGNVFVFLTKHSEEDCDGNLNVHIISFDRFRSDSLTSPSDHRKFHVPAAEVIDDDNNNPVDENSNFHHQQSQPPPPMPSDSTNNDTSWTVFNLLPEMNRSSETLAILAQIMALLSLTMIQSD